MNASEIAKILEQAGFEYVKSGDGSHRKFTDGKHTTQIPFHGSKDIGKGLLNDIWKQAGLPELKGVKTYAQAAERLEQVLEARANALTSGGPKPPSASEIADDILKSSSTEGFWADKNGRVMHFINREQMAVVSITDDGKKILRQFDNIEDANKFFGEKFNHAWQHANKPPNIIRGNLDNLITEFKATQGIWPRISGAAGDGMKFLGKVAKVLAVAGVVGATAEAAELGSLAHQAAELGIIPDDALLAYDSMLAAHIAQATVDPSLVGGEAAVQLAFEEWCDQYNIPDHVKESLEPSSLMEMVIGDIKLAKTMEALPKTPSSDMPNEVKELIQLRASVTHSKALTGDETHPSVQLAWNNLKNAHERMQNNGSYQNINDYIERETFLASLPSELSEIDQDAPQSLVQLVIANRSLHAVDKEFTEINKLGFADNPERASKAIEIIHRRDDVKEKLNDAYRVSENRDEIKNINHYLQELKSGDSALDFFFKNPALDDQPTEIKIAEFDHTNTFKI